MPALKPTTTARRVSIAGSPYSDLHTDNPHSPLHWPSRWIGLPDAPEPPFVTVYRRRFTVEAETSIRIHVSADERYALFLDGERIGRGSERGDEENWYFETYDLDLTPGEHLIVARVWSLGPQRAYAQITVSPGFLLSPDDPLWTERLGTGVASWDVQRLDGYTFTDPDPAWGTGLNVVIDGSRLYWEALAGDGEGWLPAAAREIAVNAGCSAAEPPSRLLRPATLPPMYDAPWTASRVRHVAELPDDWAAAGTNGIPIRAADHIALEQPHWQDLLDAGHSVTIPPQTCRRILLDLNDYVCAYPEIAVSGGRGSIIRVNWQEALYEQLPPRSKGDRNDIEGKYFVCAWWAHDGTGDTFLPDGSMNRVFETLWWQCGRYVEIVVQTKDEPLTVDRLILSETRYPLEMESRFAASDARLSEVTPLALRALQMCAHETFMDCPFYEQLQYIGDTRLESLTAYAITHDDRLPRKALTMFDASRVRSGLTQSRYPSRVRQIIPTFSLLWIGMAHDYALWRNDSAFVRAFLPGVRDVIDAFLQSVNEDGLLVAPAGWNFVDWVPGWPNGIPPGGSDGVIGPINWQLILALNQAADLEDWVGEPEMAARDRRWAKDLGARVIDVFWNEQRGLFSDDTSQEHYSEHAQCLAILSGHISDAQQGRLAAGLSSDADLARTTIYFTHYLFEVYFALGMTDALMDRMSIWFDLPARGLKTTVEMPEPTRSDCHAWGAHPLHHFFASLLGIRPSAPGFSRVSITPNLGSLSWLNGSMPHPNGSIDVRLSRREKSLEAEIKLPDGVFGTFLWGGHRHDLIPGEQTLTIEAGAREF